MMKKVCYYYRDHSGSAGFTLPPQVQRDMC